MGLEKTLTLGLVTVSALAFMLTACFKEDVTRNYYTAPVKHVHDVTSDHVHDHSHDANYHSHDHTHDQAYDHSHDHNHDFGITQLPEVEVLSNVSYIINGLGQVDSTRYNDITFNNTLRRMHLRHLYGGLDIGQNPEVSFFDDQDDMVGWPVAINTSYDIDPDDLINSILSEQHLNNIESQIPDWNLKNGTYTGKILTNSRGELLLNPLTIGHLYKGLRSPNRELCPEGETPYKTGEQVVDGQTMNIFDTCGPN